MVDIINQAYDGGKSSLRIAADDTLQAVFEHAEIPALLRAVLSGATAWQKRIEMKSGAALRWSPQWSGALMALGTRVISDGAEETLAAFMGRSGAVGKLAELRVPLDVPGRAWGEAHVRRTPTDTPIVSAFAVLDLDGGRVRGASLALAGVWPEAVRLAQAADVLAGGAPSAEAFRQVSDAVRSEVNPKGNYLGDAEYRREMAAVLTRRALEDCLKGDISQ